MNKNPTLGEIIKRSRKLSKLSQQELAEKLSVSNKTISAYELNRVIPSVVALKKIAQVTNQPINIFFYNDKQPEINILNLKLDSILEDLDKIKKYFKI